MLGCRIEIHKRKSHSRGEVFAVVTAAAGARSLIRRPARGSTIFAARPGAYINIRSSKGLQKVFEINLLVFMVAVQIKAMTSTAARAPSCAVNQPTAAT